MKTLITITACLLTALTSAAQPAIQRDSELEAKIEKTMATMSLDQKIGQMIELDLRMVTKVDKKGQVFIDQHMLDSLFQNYHVGSLLNHPGTHGVTAAEWEKYMAQIQKSSIKYTGIPTVFGLDQNHGTTYTLDGTLFPQNINVAATFNRELARRAAEITAYETRACSVPWTYSPTMDLSREPRWPRCWENFGEDCLVNAEMGKAMTLGFQGTDPNHIGQQNIAVSLKHFMGYGVPLSGMDRTPAIISLQDLKEKHFAPYKACVQAGALTIMVNSASINYQPVHSNKELLTGWLKEGLDWDGMLITDWADVNNLYNREHVAANKKEALCLAVNAGIDMIMEPYDCSCLQIIKELVAEGRIPASRIDDACRRILRLKYRLNLFDHPTQRLKDYPLLGSDQHRQAAYNSAVESMVLLKNNGTLPLSKNKKILLIGPNANTLRALNGAWTCTWQGKDVDELYAKTYVQNGRKMPNTIYTALCEEFGKENIILDNSLLYDNNASYDKEIVTPSPNTQHPTPDYDVIVACIGENSYCETVGNLTDLRLSENQRNMVKQLHKLGKPLVLIINEGRPRIIEDIEPLADAIVDIMLPSNSGADALAALLTGRENFSGKLPFSYPRNISTYTCYDYRASEVVGTMSGAYDYSADVSFQWPFGHGLSYTTFEYSNLNVTLDYPSTNTQQPSPNTHEGVLTVTVDVRNTGNVAGKESVLLFSQDIVASQVPEIRRLRDFTKISLAPGQQQTVTFRLPVSALKFVNAKGDWVFEPGDFNIQIANLTKKITIQ